MASGIFNVGKGRFIELYRSIKDGSRVNGAFIVILLKAAETDAVLKDYLTLDEVLTAVGNTEADFTNYARLQIEAADLAALGAPDNVGDVYEATLPDQVFLNAGGALNNSMVRCLVGYVDDSTTATNTSIEPILYYDYVTTTDGTSLLIEFPSDAFSAA